MRISDWSSDVCSSDLPRPLLAHDGDRGLRHPHRAEQVRLHLVAQVPFTQLLSHSEVSIAGVVDHDEIGRASCGERVCQYVSISVVAVSLKKKTQYTKHDLIPTLLHNNTSQYNI